MKRFSAVVSTLLAALAAGALLAPLASAAPQEVLTPVIARVIATPEAVLADDNRQHLAYELELANRAPSKITVRSIQALAGGKVVGSLSGARIKAMMVPYGGAPGNVLAGGQGAYVVMDVSFPAKAKLPQRLVHRLRIVESEPSPANATRYLAAPTRVIGRPAVVLVPPLRGPGWVVGNGCCDDFTAHRGTVLPVNGRNCVAERFAIDFVQLTPANRLVRRPDRHARQLPLLRHPIYSAARRARSSASSTACPRRRPAASRRTSPPRRRAATTSSSTWATAATPSTPTCSRAASGREVGQRVRTGQVLGLLGNSGNSDAPHLHFHLMDGPLPLASNGVPYRFTNFTVRGTVGNLEELTKGADAAITPKPLGPRSRQLPLDNQVIDFP